MNSSFSQLKYQQTEKSLMLVFAFLILLSVACGSENTPSDSHSSTQETIQADTCFLTVVDSIGVELGDSNYVFGAIREVDTGPDGDIYVLDWINCTIFRYSSEGEFVARIGGKGNGPGEMAQPGFFGILDNGIICVADGNGWLRYTITGEPIATEPDEGRGIRCMTSAGNNQLLAAIVEVEWQNDQMQIEKRICLLDAEEPDSVLVEYHMVEYFLETTDFDQFISATVMVDLFPLFFAAGEEFICVAPDPVNEPELILYRNDGSLISVLELPYVQVPKTTDEIAEEKRFIEAFFFHSTGYTRHVNWTPLPMQPMITNLGVDSLERIWVQRGFEQNPAFDLYNVSGEHLKTVFLTGRDDTDHWKFYISTNGILAVPEDPESFYSVYVLELQE